MAEGESVPNDSVEIMSGDADEIFCDPCQSDDEWKAVEGYCPICDEYLCECCLKMHRKQKITKPHEIFDREQMPRRHESVQAICVDVCKTHRPEIIRYCCKIHDAPGCGDCMTLNHPSCEKDRILDMSDGFQKTKEFKDIDEQLKKLQQELEEMGGEHDNNLKNLDKTYNNIRRNITSVRKQINEYLDEIEKGVEDKAAEMRKEDETGLNALQAEIQTKKVEIEDLLKALNDSNANVNSLFVLAKQTKHRLVTMETEINKIKQTQEQKQYEQVEFLFSNEIDKIISEQTPLGTLSRKCPGATYNRSICVMAKSDKKNCLITDCTILTPDRMVVVDAYNTNVKLIDINNNTVMSSYFTSSRPSNVTAFSTNMIAVTLPRANKILLINAATVLAYHGQIDVNNACHGIAFNHDGKLAVSYLNPGRIEILDMLGNIEHLIQPRQGKEFILQCPNYITFGQNNDTVIVSDSGTNSLNVITFGGQILCSYTHDACIHPQGIVSRADGLLFVCSYENGDIHVVYPDLQTKYIIHRKDPVEKPQCITYCGVNRRLYISNTSSYELDGNNIHLFDLNA